MIRRCVVHVRATWLLAACGLISGFGASSVRAEPASATKSIGAEDQVPTIRLTLQPAKVGRPALKYALLPPYLERTVGNGAPLYYRALLYMQRYDLKNYKTKVLEQSPQRLRDMSLEDARKMAFLGMSLWQELDGAARRERCEWDLPIRGNRQVISMYLDDAQETRVLGQWLSLRARLQAHDGKYDEAIRSLQTGYALGRDISRVPFLITQLIGVTVVNSTSQCVEEMTEFSGSPNLYWPLTALPQPMIDIRESVETELALPYQMLPFLKDVETAQHAPGEWQLLLEQAITELRPFAGTHDKLFTTEFGTKLSTTLIAMRSYPAAKQHLLAKGKTAEQIEKLPVAQVLLIHMADSWNEVGQEISKWFSLPYLEAQAGIQRAVQAEMQTRREPTLGTALPGLLMPALQQVSIAMARVDRRFAELRILEALRHYAATHDRKLPAKLSDITDLPIPNDPMTGQPFVYRLEGDTAYLDIGSTKEWHTNKKRFVLTVAK